jgi:hypothetical protein
MADTQLVLGGVAFTDFAIPEEIAFGGAQALSIKKLVGGQRAIDALGQDDADIEWSGRFQGAGAMQSAWQLDEMRKAGQPQPLSVAGLSYQVIVAEFRYRMQRLYQVLYTIRLAVVQDNTLQPQASQSTLDDLVGSDMDDANGIAPGLTDPTVLPAVSNLQAAITTAGPLQGATLTALAPVSAAAAAASSAIEASFGDNDPTILSDTGYSAGVVDPVPTAGVSPTAIIATFQAQQAAITEDEQLWELGSLVGRVETNLAQATG